jgi:hypothetical protein
MVNAFLNLQFVTGGSRKAKSQQQQKKTTIKARVLITIIRCVYYTIGNTRLATRLQIIRSHVILPK